MAALTIDDATPRHLTKLTPGVPTDGHYDELAVVFRPVFARFVVGQIVGNASPERGGNDLGRLNTVVEHADSGWLLTGDKYYCTGTIFADWVAVTAVAPGIEGRHIAVVSTRHSGVQIHDDWDGFGQQLTGTRFTRFVRVPVDTLLDPQVLEIRPESAIFQLVLLAVQAGIARAALANARAHTQLREHASSTGTGLPSRHEPQVLQVMGEISATAFAVDAIVLAAIAELESVVGQPGLSAAEQYAVCELAANHAQSAIQPLVLETASKLFDGLGASATSTSCQLDRPWRNARTVATHNPAMYKSRIVGDYEVNAAAPCKLSDVGDLKTSEGEK